jgi:GNAT superfamily N-acetyltransferase
MLNELYRAPAGEETGAALAFLSRGIGGAEAYTFLRLNRDRIPEGVFFCAFANGTVKSVVYNNGDRTVETAPGVDPYPGLRLLRFAGPPPLPDARLCELTTADVPEIYKILGGKKLSPDDEARCVYRIRAMRDGFAKGYGVKENGTLLSFAFIVAQNEDSALLGDVYTRPAYRGKGYASAAVRACIAAARKDAYVLCEEKNVGFYERLGFREISD